MIAQGNALGSWAPTLPTSPVRGAHAPPNPKKMNKEKRSSRRFVRRATHRVTTTTPARELTPNQLLLYSFAPVQFFQMKNLTGIKVKELPM
jgi:hypothetical protein